MTIGEIIYIVISPILVAIMPFQSSLRHWQSLLNRFGRGIKQTCQNFVRQNRLKIPFLLTKPIDKIKNPLYSQGIKMVPRHGLEP